MNLHAIFADIASLTAKAGSLPWSAIEQDAMLILGEIQASPLVPATLKPYLVGLVQAIQLLEQFTPPAPTRTPGD